MLHKLKNEHYYGSDLNKFIDEKCSHQMDCINIDCLQIKVSKKRIRFIESKKDNEHTPKSEIRAMNILKYLLSKQQEWKVEFCIVSGNYPFQSAEIFQFGTEELFTLNQEQLIKWLNFEEG